MNANERYIEAIEHENRLRIEALRRLCTCETDRPEERAWHGSDCPSRRAING